MTSIVNQSTMEDPVQDIFMSYFNPDWHDPRSHTQKFNWQKSRYTSSKWVLAS